MGGGLKTVDRSRRPMSDVMPSQADWLKTKVAEFRPDENMVVTVDGSKVKYDYLVVAVGLKVAFEKVGERLYICIANGGKCICIYMYIHCMWYVTGEVQYYTCTMYIIDF